MAETMGTPEAGSSPNALLKHIITEQCFGFTTAPLLAMPNEGVLVTRGVALL